MPRIQDPELVERLRRRLGLRGAAPIDTVAPEIVPILDVDRLAPLGSRFDAAYAAGLAAQAASATNFGRGVLFNPAGSGLAVDLVSCVVASTSGAFSVRLVRHTGVLGTVHSTRYYHSAYDLLTSTACTVTSEVAASASLTQVVDYVSLLNQTPWSFEVEGITLFPGQGIGVQLVDANVAFTAAFRWRERQLTIWERELVS